MEADPSTTIYFETLDNRRNRITCTLLDWEHVCRRPHEYMEGEEQEVKDALANPDHGLRYFDCDYPSRRVYYMNHQAKKCYVKVIVEFENEQCIGDGHIVTAFETYNKKDCESLEIQYG